MVNAADPEMTGQDCACGGSSPAPTLDPKRRVRSLVFLCDLRRNCQIVVALILYIGDPQVQQFPVYSQRFAHAMAGGVRSTLRSLVHTLSFDMWNLQWVA